MKRINCFFVIIVSVVIALSNVQIFAGPPFETDDPQPVDYLHWEFYVSSVMEYSSNDLNATLPHFEINYGAVPNGQIHLLAPLGYVQAGPEKHYGYMDTELGLKYRFVNDSSGLMVGIFPLVELPTGNQNKQLGNGKVQAYLPLWLQKSWGKCTTYGGAGYWYNPGIDNKNWIFAGWEAQYDFSDSFTLGGELYFHSADTNEGTSFTGLNIGGIINIGEHNHILLSIGHSFNNNGITTGYAGYQMTI